MTGLLLISSMVLATGAFAATIAKTTTCSNGVDNTGGLGLICEVTVVNRITAHGGSARVTVRECHGAAGDPEAACTTKTTNLSKPVTAVNQCNGSINGGGGTLRCSVRVRNNFVALKTGATAVTVDQCVGSGDGVANECDPFPATTTGATITQCNGSANGGNLVQLKCTATGTASSSARVTIDQCNDSANGGGALVICSAAITNRRVTAASESGALPQSDTLTTTDTAPSGPTPVVLVGIYLIALIFIAGRLLGAGGTRGPDQIAVTAHQAHSDSRDRHD